ncbi:MAG TPA: amidohydrolase [Bacteroidales bacterium]|nr:amidohydrolase [Bacteroidales bacterium]
MKITVLQPEIRWEDRQANLLHLESLIQGTGSRGDLIILPEMFPTGFSMSAGTLAEGPGSPTVSWMKKMASQYGTALCGSYISVDSDKYCNRFIFVAPDREIIKYDKRHLFRMGGESSHYSPGQERVIIEFSGFRILPAICYDLRFPVWLRNRGDYDLIVCVANWPEPKRDVWNVLLRARAIENQCYVAASNRIGSDGDGISYAGESVILDPKGNELAAVSSHSEGTASAEIDLHSLNVFREKFPAWKDADDFIIR